MTPVRRLNIDGRRMFREWLERGAPNPAPTELLTEVHYSENVGWNAEVEQRAFETRLDLGGYLVDQFAAVPTASIAFDEGLWDWLSLYYIDQLLPPDVSGNRSVKEIVRYMLELENRKWSRHILRVSWLAVKEHGTASRVMLSVPPSKHSDVIEQIGGQQEAFGASSVVRLADILYWDSDNDRLKRGAQGKSGGTPRRLVRFLRQFRRTFDPPRMSAEQLLEALPREFDKWRKSERARSESTRADAISPHRPA